jgi:hypothetical protein
MRKFERLIFHPIEIPIDHLKQSKIITTILSYFGMLIERIAIEMTSKQQ